MRKKQVSLGVIFPLLFAVFAVAIILVTSVFTYVSYRKSMIAKYSEYAVSIANIVKSSLDAETILGYAATLEPDERYFEILNYIRSIQGNSSVEFIYVQVPLSDTDVLYIFDSYEAPPDSDVQHSLGLIDDYNDSFSSAKQAMITGETTATLEITTTIYGYLASVYVPILDHTGKAVGYVGVDMAMDPIVNFLTSYMIQNIVMSVAVVAVCFALLLLAVRKTVVEPIQIIVENTVKFTDNIENANFGMPDIRSSNELQTLSASIDQMFNDIRRYTLQLALETAQKERIESDLATAKNIQESILPRTFPPFYNCPEVSIFASMNAAKAVGGDFYDFFLIDDSHIALVIADVSGKGIPAALFMMVSRTLIKNQTLAGASPEDVMRIVNNQICENNDAYMFVTAFLGVLNFKNGHLRYANAGHNDPIIKKTDGCADWLHSDHNLVLGAMDNTTYTLQQTTLSSGDSLILYTDGVTEATTVCEELFSDDRLLTLARDISPDETAKAIVNRIEREVDLFVKDAEQADDITLMVLKMQ